MNFKNSIKCLFPFNHLQQRFGTLVFWRSKSALETKTLKTTALGHLQLHSNSNFPYSATKHLKSTEVILCPAQTSCPKLHFFKICIFRSKITEFPEQPYIATILIPDYVAREKQTAVERSCRELQRKVDTCRKKVYCHQDGCKRAGAKAFLNILHTGYQIQLYFPWYFICNSRLNFS